LIFGCWDIVGLLVVYFFIAETKCLSLEDLDDVFAAKYPRRRASELVKNAKEREQSDRQLIASQGGVLT
jgi:hypothetical protein